MNRTRLTRSAVVAAVIAVTAVVGVAGASSAPAATTGSTIDVSARSFAFSPSTLSLTAGEPVTIKLSSTDTFHDFVVNGPGVKNKVVVKLTGAGKTRRGTLNLAKPGKYQLYCSVTGHRAAGMRGTITVS